jgi:hypothetical protein
VGDNGNWAPLGVQTIGAIAQNSFVDIDQNWVPVVGQHTCLKLYASAQLGEISGGNNFAQENVFDFEAAASSPPAPVMIRTAIRNPLDERRIVRVGVKGVPLGWRVHFPHSWVWLDAKAEKQFDLTVIPMFDWSAVAGGAKDHNERKLEPTAKVRLEGIVARAYDTPLAPKNEPAGSRAYPIGGILGRVHVRKQSRIWIEPGLLEKHRENEVPAKSTIAVHGGIGQPFDKQRVRVVCTDPRGRDRIVQVFTDPDGRFEALFDLLIEPSLEASPKLWKKAKDVEHGTYRVRAFVVAATLMAEAESNELYIAR